MNPPPLFLTKTKGMTRLNRHVKVKAVLNLTRLRKTMKITSGIKKTVATIDEHHTVLEAAKLMTENYIGSVVVTSHSKIVGIFTERELMMRVVGKGREPEKVKIKDVMHTDHLKIGSEATCEEALHIMEKKRCRHLLVFDGDEFIGLISLRDIVVLTLHEKDDLITQLEGYISAT